MSANDELIDYEDDQEIVANGAAAGGTVAKTGDGVEGKNFSGIHSTGFR